jgi:Uncharacterised nucleotidyltransferase
MTPRQDSIARLLLLLAKVDLSPSQAAAVRGLAAEVQDWDAFTELAARKHIATLAYKHLQAHAHDAIPVAHAQRLRQIAHSFALGALRVVAAQIAFHRSCITPLRARHLYLKGTALAQLCYHDAGDRYCRDIDVLIHDHDLAKVVDSAIAVGYRALVSTVPARLTDEPADLRFLCRHADVVTLIGPEGVGVEVHRRLDKLSVGFPHDEMFETACGFTIGGTPALAPSAAFHFVYICYHHSRHFWSRLHWLADLDAMVRAPDFDRTAVLLLAERIGIRPTVEAALDFQAILATPLPWAETLSRDGGGGQFLRACLINLNGDLDLEEELRKDMTLQDFMSAWQISPGRYHSFWFKSWLRRLRPSPTQYFERRYPRWLHWVYVAQNALALARNALGLVTAAIGKAAPHR